MHINKRSQDGFRNLSRWSPEVLKSVGLNWWREDGNININKGTNNRTKLHIRFSRKAFQIQIFQNITYGKLGQRPTRTLIWPVKSF